MTLDDDQTAIVLTALGVVQDLGLPERAGIICVETMIVESNIAILANPNVPSSMTIPHTGVGEDHASVGPYQQQVPEWGTAAQCMDPATSTDSFLDRLTAIPGWESMPTGEAAQAVQVSAFPDRYQQQETNAIAIVNQLWNEVFTLSNTAEQQIQGIYTQIDSAVAPGQKDFASTVRAILSLIQSMYNQLNAMQTQLTTLEGKLNA